MIGHCGSAMGREDAGKLLLMLDDEDKTRQISYDDDCDASGIAHASLIAARLMVSV